MINIDNQENYAFYKSIKLSTESCDYHNCVIVIGLELNHS